MIFNGSAPASGPGTAAGTLFLPWGTPTSSLWFDQVGASGLPSPTGSDLKVDILGTNQSITVKNWFTAGDAYAQLAEISVNHGQSVDTGLAPLLAAMSNFEASYAKTNGVAFNPAAAANTKVTDPTVLATLSSAWHS